MKTYFTAFCHNNLCFYCFHRQSIAPSVVGSLKDGDDKGKKIKQPIIIWPEWSDQDINQEKWVRNKITPATKNPLS